MAVKNKAYLETELIIQLNINDNMGCDKPMDSRIMILLLPYIQHTVIVDHLLVNVIHPEGVDIIFV